MTAVCAPSICRAHGGSNSTTGPFAGSGPYELAICQKLYDARLQRKAEQNTLLASCR